VPADIVSSSVNSGTAPGEAGDSPEFTPAG